MINILVFNFKFEILVVFCFVNKIKIIIKNQQ